MTAASRRDWKALKAKRVLRQADVRGCPDEQLLAATQSDGVVPRSSLDYRVWNPTKDLHNYKLVEPDQFVISLRSFQGGIEHSMHRGIVSPAYTVMTLDTDCDVRFFKHLLKSSVVVTQLDVLGSGIRQGKKISYESFGQLVLELPPMRAQRAIADFLDQETERIDRLVEKKRRLIELLEEKRTALISHAVTKGLDPTVPMKDSGIPWLGEIPAHWDAVPLRRHLASITDGPFGSSLTSSHYAPEGARVIRLGNVGQGEFLGEDEAFITMDYYQELIGHAVKAGDIVIAGLGDERRTLGRACLVPDELGPAIVKADCFRVRMTGAVDHTFLADYLSSGPGAVGAWLLARGTTRQRINTQVARDLPIPVPPAPEQRIIAKELFKRGIKFTAAVSKVQDQLNKLAEYRQALITTAVTGQIEVTERSPDPEEAIA